MRFPHNRECQNIAKIFITDLCKVFYHYNTNSILSETNILGLIATLEYAFFDGSALVVLINRTLFSSLDNSRCFAFSLNNAFLFAFKSNHFKMG